MRSIFVKILFWFAGSLVLFIVGTVVTTSYIYRANTTGRSFFPRAMELQADEAASLYERGGAKELQVFLDRWEKSIPGEYVLVDRNGIDVVTKKDRKELIRMRTPRPPRLWPGILPLLPPRENQREVWVWDTTDHKYSLLVHSAIRHSAWNALPYYIWIVAAATVFSYLLALQLVSPLRKLKSAAQQFGEGDFSARVRLKRHDEFGQLAQAFNEMAVRIETLMTAERRLLQDVSHELRSPLARLEFAVELARTSHNREAAFERIKKEVGRLSSLVGELLQVTRAEGDPASRNMQELSLNNLLQDLIEDSSMESQARGCQLTLECSSPIQIIGDRELLRRAVENVLRNAIRYSPDKTPIRVEVTRKDDKAVISVRDFGPGVPHDSLPLLFQPFFRVDSDRNRNNGGVGLGLAIAKRAVTLHNGELKARNATPGLEVQIEIPVSEGSTEGS
jgi:signal transduction histidine kinase